MTHPTPAIVLLSGGLDSATVLAEAVRAGHAVHALSFDYGQRHRCELEAAAQVAEHLGAVQHRVFPLDLSAFGGSALTDAGIDVPEDAPGEGIPVTYVPARNTVFLSIALAWAEAIGAHDLYIGVNAVDYSGYPDCRPVFIEAFRKLANLGTRDGAEGRSFRVHAPLIDMSKADIVRRGMELGVDYGLTVSCYQPDDAGLACGRCHSCQLRREGFQAAGLPDPTRYQPGAAG